MKNTLIAILGAFGLQIKYTAPKFLRKKIVKKIPLGKHSILIDTATPLYRLYKKKPNYSSELGRLVEAMVSKYPSLEVIDIGANIGDTLCIIKSAADVPILCIEGDNYCYGFLEKNAKQFSNVKLEKVFLGEKTINVKVVLDKEGWNTTIIPEETPGNSEIRLVSLDDLLSNSARRDKYKLIKLDTEGFDTKIIRGGLKMIEEICPVIYFEYNRDCMQKVGEAGLDTLEILKSLGYNKILFYEASGRYFLSTTLSNTALINDLHHAVDGFNSHIYYWDLILFHESDNDLADAFIAKEERHRISHSGRRS